MQQADHLGALLVHGGSVEIVDFDVGGGAHGMGEGTRVLGKLALAQRPDVLDPLHRS